MIEIILYLLLMILAQLLTSIFCWFLIKKISKNINKIIIIEIVIVSMVALILVYDAIKLSIFSIFFVIAGIFFFLIIDKLLPHKDRKDDKVTLLIFLAMCLHELPEGISFIISYMINPEFGLIILSLITLHMIPESIIVSIPHYLKKDLSGGIKSVLFVQLLFALGVFIAYFFMSEMHNTTKASYIALTAGAMIYIIYEEILMVINKKNIK